MKITDEAVQAAINAWFEETREHVKSVEPLPEQARRMRLALEASLPYLQPFDVAAVRELRKIWYIRDLTTGDFDKAEAMLSALSAAPVDQTAEIERLREALNYYANVSPISYDMGHAARAALSGKKPK